MNKNNQQELLNLLKSRYGIPDPILEVMKIIPRDLFVPHEQQSEAYENHPLPIGCEQTISQPYIVARMTAILLNAPHQKSKVLEIGTGSGYQAAILSKFYKNVYTIERIQSLHHEAKKRLDSLNIHNVHCYYGDGILGLPEFSPFDAIIITAATPQIPATLLSQLVDQGQLLTPIGETGETQRLQFITKKGHTYTSIDYDWVSFVPLLKGTE